MIRNLTRFVTVLIVSLVSLINTNTASAQSESPNLKIQKNGLIQFQLITMERVGGKSDFGLYIGSIDLGGVVEGSYLSCKVETGEYIAYFQLEKAGSGYYRLGLDIAEKSERVFMQSLDFLMGYTQDRKEFFSLLTRSAKRIYSLHAFSLSTKDNFEENSGFKLMNCSGPKPIH